MKLTYLGHAAMMLESGGKRILMDPWLTDPAYHGTWWHFPPLALGPRDLPPLDYIYISHEHADHFDPPTLQQLSKDVEIVIAKFRNRRFRDRIAALGFSKITEIEWEQPFPWAPGSRLRLIAPDRAWDDSAILLSDGTTNVLNVNDCHLDHATLEGLGSEQSIDIAFLTFTGASQYPGCYELPEAEKRRRCLDAKQSHLEEFATWAKLLRAKCAVPAAGNFAFLTPEQLALNTPDYVNTPREALDLLAHVAPGVEGLQMNPGDVWTPESGLQRLHPPPDWDKRIATIEAMSREQAPAIAARFAAEKPAPTDLYDRFHAYFTELLEADPDAAKRINIIMWWAVEGPAGGNWVIDFTRDRDWVSRGQPQQWNLRMRIPDRLVALGVADEAVWEDLVLSFRVRLARNPDRYPKEFWTWFCKLQGRKYLRRK